MRRALLALVCLFSYSALLLETSEFLHAQSAKTSGSRAVSGGAAASGNAAGAPVTMDEVNSFMHHTFGWNPDLKWQVVNIGPAEAPGVTEVDITVNAAQGQQPLVLFITPDGGFAINGEMVPFGADPFAATRQLLSRAAGPAKGPADAPLTIVEFSDLQCPHCKAAQPTIDKLLADNPNARFIFESYPLPMHDWAYKAAGYSLCVHQQNADAFWKFVAAVYDAQDGVTTANADAKLTELATAAGVNGQTAAACASSAQTKSKIDQSLALGKEAGVTGTPTLFLNGRKIQNVSGTPFEVLSAITKFQAGQGK